MEPLRATSPDGTVIACHVAGEGPPLVLVHGTSADHSRWATILPRLAERFTTYAVDRRGRGASSDTEPYSIEREFEDIAAVIDAIDGSVDLLGHSYGAVCSLEAATRTSNLRRLVLYEPPLPVGVGGLNPRAQLERAEAQLAAGDREGVLRTFMRDIVRVPEAEFEALRLDPSWKGRIAGAHTIPRELRFGEHYEPDFARFAELRVPTLLLFGSESPPFLIEPVRRLQEAIPGALLVDLRGQGHNAMTTAPDVFLDAVVGFLTAP